MTNNDKKEQSFMVGDYDYDHEVGNIDCKQCWHGGPSKCDQCDKGLVHTSFGDENSDGDYWLYYQCDNCDNTTNPD